MSRSSLLLPAEWSRQKAIWIGWPGDLKEWPAGLTGPRREISGLVHALLPHIEIHLVAGTPEAFETAKAACPAPVSVHELPMGDIWLRDTGPVFVVSGQTLSGLAFGFNGWGGRYILPGDTQTAEAILQVTGSPGRRHDFILEGGAIDHNGAGTLLTTRQCLLNANRNKNWNESKAEAALKETFGATSVIWLEEGLVGDHTDGHIDNIARFIGETRILCQRPFGDDDPNRDILLQIEADLRATGLDIVTIPSPGRILDAQGEPLPASHMNFIFANDLVVVPVYNEAAGQRAVLEFAALLPEHKVIGLPSRHILCGGGSFHCISQQMPQIAVSGAPDPKKEVL